MHDRVLYVESLHDTAVRLASADEAEARAMPGEPGLAPLPHGVHGELAVDLPAVSDTIARFSRLAAAAPGVSLRGSRRSIGHLTSCRRRYTRRNIVDGKDSGSVPGGHARELGRFARLSRDLRFPDRGTEAMKSRP